MSLSRDEVEHIAGLARIDLGEEEKAKFEKELSVILDFIGELNWLDTVDVEIMSGGTLLENVMREDSQVSRVLEGTSDKLLDYSPQRKDNWVKVKGVFEY